MQPTYVTVMAVFTQQTRYTVPLFQRPYVWGKDEQWAPLWDDIRAVAQRTLNANGKPIASHFLGTVVLEQARNSTGSLPRREIIDGQQRLTTLQLVLKAVEHALDATKAMSVGDEKVGRTIDMASRQIAPLTENPAYADEEERYKVWPTNEDREPFRRVMDANSSNALKLGLSRMAEAYHFFRTECQSWLAIDRTAERAVALASALKDHMKVIVLDLDPEDEPQAIFETLNAHGTPLLPADLIKNWLLWEASRQSLPTEPLYVDFWRPFDRDFIYWRERIGTGHAARARIDTFLQNWLTRRTRRVIAAKHLYNQFLDHVKEPSIQSDEGKIDVQALMQSIAGDAERFRYIEQPMGTTRFDVFLRRLKTLDIVVFYPLLLAILGRDGSDQADRDTMGAALESFLVRRIICNEQTRGYGSLVLTLLNKLAGVSPDQPAAPMLLEVLADSEGANSWPNDARFKQEWCSRRFYGYLRRDRVLMVLRAIEEAYQIEHVKSEPILGFDYSRLEIEHVMPQEWEAHWPLETDIASRDDRNGLIHAIGNLTLVGGKLNKTLSNGPWVMPLEHGLGTEAERDRSKRKGLDDHSKLELNARLLKQYPHAWNETMIRQRTRELYDAAERIWPSAREFQFKLSALAGAEESPHPALWKNP